MILRRGMRLSIVDISSRGSEGGGFSGSTERTSDVRKGNECKLGSYLFKLKVVECSVVGCAVASLLVSVDHPQQWLWKNIKNSPKALCTNKQKQDEVDDEGNSEEEYLVDNLH